MSATEPQGGPSLGLSSAASRDATALRGFDRALGTRIVPNDLLDFIIPYQSRAVVRLVSVLVRDVPLRKDPGAGPAARGRALGIDELVELCGMSRSSVIRASKAATTSRILAREVGHGRGRKTSYALGLSERKHYTVPAAEWDGFYAGRGCFTVVPSGFFDEVLLSEELSTIRVVSAVVRHTLGWGTRDGRARRESVALGYRQFAGSATAVSSGLKSALERGFIRRTREGTWSPAGGSRAAAYEIRWADTPAKPCAPAFGAENGLRIGAGGLGGARGATTDAETVSAAERNGCHQRSVEEKEAERSRKQPQIRRGNPAPAGGDSLLLIRRRISELGLDGSQLSDLLIREAIQAVGVRPILDQLDGIPHLDLRLPAVRYVGKFLREAVANGRPWDPAPQLIALREHGRRRLLAERDRRMRDEDRRAHEAEVQRELERWLALDYVGRADAVLELWGAVLKGQGLATGESFQRVRLALAEHIRTDTKCYRRRPRYVEVMHRILRAERATGEHA